MKKLKRGVKLGPFFLEKLVGRGGFGEVWAAREEDEKSGKLFALKVLTPKDGDYNDYTQFVDESRAAKAMRHPNIVRVHSLQHLDGFFVQLMEFIDGMPISSILEKCIRDDAKIPIKWALSLAHDVCSGLSYMHEKGLIHRDLTPHNVLVTREGTAKLGDFGISVFSGRLNSTDGDSIKGKLSYMSPEQFMKDELTLKADIFSTGILFWELFTSRKLFPTMSLSIYADVIAAGRIPLISEFDADIPEEIVELVADMVRLSPARRIPDMFYASETIEIYLREAKQESSRTITSFFNILEYGGVPVQGQGVCPMTSVKTKTAPTDSIFSERGDLTVETFSDTKELKT